MNSRPENIHNERSLSAIMAEMKEELKEFTETRIEMLKSELREKTARWKTAGPLVVIGAVLAGTAYLLITLALVALVAVIIGDNSFRWVFAFGIVGILWALLGGVAIYIGIREFQVNHLVPRKTIEVLKGDKTWLQNEARSQA